MSDIKACPQCSRKFEAFPASKQFCDDCAEKRTKRRSQLFHQKLKTERKLEKKLGTTLPTQAVEGWKELILEDLANPFSDFTESDLCAKYGVKVSDYYDFKVKTPGFLEEIEKRSEKYKDQEGIFFRKMLIKRAKNGSDMALQIGLTMTKQYNRKALEEDPNAGLSDEDKKRRIEQLLTKLEGNK